MRLAEIIANARRAKAQTGRGVIAQLIDIARLRLLGNGVLAETYFNFRLFDPGIPFAAKARFAGPWIKNRIYRIQDPQTARLCNDKLRAYRYFEDHGFAYPRVLAATHPAVELPGMEALRSPGAIANWLAERAPYPFFVKPAASYLGYGNKLVAARDGDWLLLGNGERIAVDAFVQQHGAPDRPVMLFQELIRPHPILQRHIGDRAATTAAGSLAIRTSTGRTSLPASTRAPSS